MLSNIGAYSKAIVGIASAVLTGLQPYYGHAAWYPAVIASIGAVLVYIVPNTSTPAITPAVIPSAATTKNTESE